jgi:hypothetical protein
MQSINYKQTFMSLHKEYHKLPSGHDIEASITFKLD